MSLELELGDGAEVPAAAVKGPEEIGMVSRARPDDLAAGGDDLERAKVVAGQAVLAREPADASAERKATHAGFGDDSGRDDEAVLGGRGVDVAQQAASLGPDHVLAGMHLDRPHAGEVDRESAVRNRLARHAVAAATHGDLEAVAARQVDGRYDILGRGAASNDSRPLGDHRVPDRPGLVVCGLTRDEDLACKGPPELFRDG